MRGHFVPRNENNEIPRMGKCTQRPSGHDTDPEGVTAMNWRLSGPTTPPVGGYLENDSNITGKFASPFEQG